MQPVWCLWAALFYFFWKYPKLKDNIKSISQQFCSSVHSQWTVLCKISRLCPKHTHTERVMVLIAPGCFCVVLDGAFAITPVFILAHAPGASWHIAFPWVETVGRSSCNALLRSPVSLRKMHGLRGTTRWMISKNALASATLEVTQTCKVKRSLNTHLLFQGRKGHDRYCHSHLLCHC